MGPWVVAPDLEDYNDRNDIKHDFVRGSIIMPRIQFLLDDGPSYDDREYDDYAGIYEPVDNCRKEKLKPDLKGQFSWRAVHKNRKSKREKQQDKMAKIMKSRRNEPIPMIPDYRDPTLEEMVPFYRIKENEDTIILMADDPVLIINDKRNCQTTTMSSTTGGSGITGGSTTTAASTTTAKS